MNPGEAREVAVVRARPDRIVEDIGRALELARPGLDPLEDTILVLHPPPRGGPPEAGTRPWALGAAVRWLREAGHAARALLPVANGPDDEAVVRAAAAAGWLRVLGEEGLRLVPLPEVDWIEYPFKRTTEALRDLHQGFIPMPKLLPGKQVLHLLPPAAPPRGAAEAGAAWLPWGSAARLRNREDALRADLVLLEREVGIGHLVLLDLCGFAPEADLVLASCDPVALDAAHARLFGLSPRSLPHLGRCEERGLGRAAADLVGDAPPEAPLTAPAGGPLTFLGRRARRRAFLASEWGRLFREATEAA